MSLCKNLDDFIFLFIYRDLSQQLHRLAALKENGRSERIVSLCCADIAFKVVAANCHVSVCADIAFKVVGQDLLLK